MFTKVKLHGRIISCISETAYGVREKALCVDMDRLRCLALLDKSKVQIYNDNVPLFQRG